MKDEGELAEQMAQLLRDPQRLATLGQRAKEVTEKYRGATDRTLAIVTELLQKSS